MTRRGKIARLPMDIREEVNRRLENAVEGKQIVQWLNTRPEVAALMAAQFDGQPVNEPNLSHWKTGGFRDWQTQQEALGVTSQVLSDAAELTRKSGGKALESLAVCLTARTALSMQNMPSAGEHPKAHLEWLRWLCAILSQMRKGDHNLESLKLKRDKFDLEVKKFEAVAAARKLAEQKLQPEGTITKEGWEQLERELKLI